jgi:hypothetical protein
MNSEDLYTMFYWIFGIITVIFLIDWLIYKPIKERKKTDNLIKDLCSTNILFEKSIPKYTLDKGIVICMNNTTFIEGFLLLNTLRYIGSKLPILVVYNKNDLINDYIKLVETIDNTKIMLIDVKNEFIKPTALIYSPYKQVLLLEPDLLFLKSPDYLFEEQMYKNTGAIFWKDNPKKSIWDQKVYDWVRKIIPYRKGDNSILNKKNGSFQNQSIILINKSTHIKTLEKLWTLINEWKHIHKHLNDKEYYWLAAEIANEPYTVIPYFPGIIGQQKEITDFNNNQKPMLCGKLLFVDINGQPLCCEGSLFDPFDKNTITEFTHYSMTNTEDNWYNNDIISVLEEKCIYNSNISELPNVIKNLFNNYLFILQNIRKQLNFKKK